MFMDMDKMVGADFEKGLGAMKRDRRVEGGAAGLTERRRPTGSIRRPLAGSTRVNDERQVASVAPG